MQSCERAGTQQPYYRVQVELDEAGIRAAHCTCPYKSGGLYKHAVALLLTYVHQRKRFAVRKSATDLLSALDRDDLRALLTRLLRARPELYEWVEAQVAWPATSGKRKRTRKRVDTDVYRRRVIAIVHSLDGMRASEAYWHVEALTHQLGEVRDSALKFLDAGDAETALAILMALVEEGGHAIEFVDDSNGFLGDFINGLGQPLAEVILSLNLSAVEREKLLRQLQKQSRYLADYGMDDGLDLATQAASVGWGDSQVPAATSLDDDDEEHEADWDDGVQADVWRANMLGDLTDAKLNVLKRQGSADEYLVLCQQTGRHLRYALMLCELQRVPQAITYAQKPLSSAADAHQMAERLRELGHIAEAIALGERGLVLAGPKAALGEWLGPIEEAQQRIAQALEAWLAAFAEHPTLTTYETVKRLAGTKWHQLQPQVMQTLRRSHDAMTLAQVLLAEEEWDEAIKIAERRDVWYTVVELVADALTPHRPDWVARISLRYAERLMREAKSKN